MKNNVVLSFLIALSVILTFIMCPDLIFKDKQKNADNLQKVQEPAVVISAPQTPVREAVTKLPKQQRISFIACGDNIVHSTILADAKDKAQGTDQEYEFTGMFENVADIIKDADLAYINQESPFGGPDRAYTGYPRFSSPDQVGFDLMELGFDIINLANNHMLDAGTTAYARTIDFWEDKDAVAIGGYRNAEEYEDIKIIEKDGVKIALLSYTYGTNGLVLSQGSDMIIPLCDSEGTADMDRHSKKARELADIVIVSVHWGHEDWFKPSALQKEQMQVLVNNGVDVIIGTHPHVLEPMQWVARPDGKRTLVMYSLGNFMSGMLYMRNMVGGIAGFDIVKFGDEAYIDSPYFIPTISHCDTSWRNFKVYKVSEYTEELFESHRCQRISDPGRSIDYIYDIIYDAIPQEFLIEDFYDREEGEN